MLIFPTFLCRVCIMEMNDEKDESVKSKKSDDVKPKIVNNSRRREPGPNAPAPFYRYNFQNFRPASFPVRRWAAAPDVFYDDGADGDYHPAQKRSQQFMKRSALTLRPHQQPRRRKHLQSCNDYHLISGDGFDQRRRRKSRSITGSKENLADLIANNSPVNKLINSDSEDEESAKERKRSALPLPEKRLLTLSGTVPLVGYSPKFGGASMCLSCMEFFDLPAETTKYVKHLLENHKLVIEDIELIVDLKRRGRRILFTIGN
uniref:Uncharacterized protein n=1 Tax=Romanomermis culicivorax TaxID=13658 RepID=A0A915JQT3_ROMCU